ncbi:MAG: serine/threonine protein kinase [Candidatus Obscuribacterales bacterium]|nr:serine/threonine protein kinase [Steroidobacteraceae bacterium]
MNAPISDQADPRRSTDPSGLADSSIMLNEIVRRATSLPAAERVPFLTLSCAGDNSLLAQALDHLRRSSPEWWDQSIESHAFENEKASDDFTGEVIGPYRIVRSLGSGGMGEVLLAERDDQQFRQQVAVKLVRRGTVSKSVQARLKVERQILASLDHPNIARLLDGGATKDGTPYIVMEYIDGEPIDTYCNRRNLNVATRLQLFRNVCAAVHYAHQNLIVHRDLKPSNILVTAEGVPKLLDFGIAKLLDDRHHMHTMAVTQADIRVMTPEHASPEQVRGDVITTASDVYCLGVLLYELLCDARPYTIKSQRLSEIERAICDQPPLPLESCLQKNSLSRLCETRSTTPARLRRELTGDLANIVMTALRKEAERRYSSAEQFAADIDRYLHHMPVAASKDTWHYRAKKFATRNRVGVGIATTAVIGVAAFAVVATVQARRIAREQTKAAHVSSFLVDLFEHADPTNSRGKEITVREMLDIGARKISMQLSEQPETRADLQATVGKVFTDLGLYDDAVLQLQASLSARRALFGENHRDTAQSMQRLGEALLSQGKRGEAAPLLQNALAINRKSYGNNSIEVAASLRSLGKLRADEQQPERAETLFRDSLSILTSQTKPANAFNALAETSSTLNNLAQLLESRADYVGAENLYRRSLSLSQAALGRDHPNLAFNVHNLAVVLQKQGKLEEAQPLFQESLALYRKLFGHEHPETLAALANYGMFLFRMRDLDGAERVYREVLALDRKVRGEQHSYTGYDRVNLGALLHDRELYVEAEAEFRAALAIYAQSLPPNHAYEGSARRALAITLIAMHRSREAEQELKQALTIFRASLTDDNPQLLAVRGALGKAFADQKRYAEAEPLLRDTYHPLLKALGNAHPLVTRQRAWISELYGNLNKPEKAAEFLAGAQNPQVPDQQK